MSGKALFQQGDALFVEKIRVVFGHFGVGVVIRDTQFAMTPHRRRENKVNPLGFRFKVVGKERKFLEVSRIDARGFQLVNLLRRQLPCRWRSSCDLSLKY